MGREATIHAEVGTETGEVRALLEGTELILRGEIRRRFPKAAMEAIAVEGDRLCFRVASEAVALHFGAKAAQSWAVAIAKPPVSLRAKLGLVNGARAFLLGHTADTALNEAIEHATVADLGQAQMMIAIINGPDDLAEAEHMHAGRPALPLWAIYPKGRDVAFGDTAIRGVLRAAGFRDTKSCAVSERLTATRYNR